MGQERPPARTEGTDPDGSDGKSGLDSAVHSQGGYWLLLTWKPSGHRLPIGISVLGYLYINICPYVHACKHKLYPVVVGGLLCPGPCLVLFNFLRYVRSWIKNTKPSMLFIINRPALSVPQRRGLLMQEPRSRGWKTSKAHWIRQANRVGQPEQLEIHRRL